MKESRSINVSGIGSVQFEHSSRARRIVISIRPHKGVRVAVPGHASLDSAMEFVEKKKQWIQKQQVRIAGYENQKKALSESFAAIDLVEAGKKLTSRLKELAEKHGFSYNRVFLKNQQTRWGSCSPKNNISLNMKLVVLPRELIDYVIIHELVHTCVHDHSKRFWSELDKYVGSGKGMARKLRNYDTRWT
jgi:predicted metal-dependent hydrolase